jgi:hypothetical protein
MSGLNDVLTAAGKSGDEPAGPAAILRGLGGHHAFSLCSCIGRCDLLISRGHAFAMDPEACPVSSNSKGVSQRKGEQGNRHQRDWRANWGSLSAECQPV